MSTSSSLAPRPAGGPSLHLRAHRHNPSPAPQQLFVQRGQAVPKRQVACNASAPARVDVAVCGGGLGGLALASALQRRGYDAHVFEAAPQLRTSHGTVIGITNNGSTALTTCVPECLQQLMDAGVERSAFSTGTKRTKDGPLERAEIPLVRQGDYRYFGIRWSEAQRVLSGFVSPDMVHCGHKATGYTELPEHGLVKLHFQGKPDVEARLAVAADGVRSAIRASMLPNDPGPRYLGQMNYGALMPNDGLVPFDKGLLQRDQFVPLGSDVWTMQVLVIDTGGKHTYWNVGINSDEPTYMPDANGQRPPKGFLVFRAGHPGCKEYTKKLLRDVGFDHILPFVEGTPEELIYERPIVDRIPLDELGANMFSEGGRVVLLGDAAHAMHPGPGLGAQMAFEDACVLASLLDKHREGLAGWNGTSSGGPLGADRQALLDLLHEYNDARLARACRVQRFTLETSGIAALRDTVRPNHLSPEEYQARTIEFMKWVTQFPNNLTGDPSSKYWKPEPMVKQLKLSTA